MSIGSLGFVEVVSIASKDLCSKLCGGGGTQVAGGQVYPAAPLD